MKPFRLYRNLHKGNFSIQSYLKEKKGYRVTDRASSVILEDCNFRIYENGRQKVIQEKRKNVHAYVEAKSYSKVNKNIDIASLREIYYNPYDHDSFIYKDTQEKLDSISRILAHNNKLYDVTNSLV